MVSAGRILILPKGAWDNLTSYSMLDLVTASNNIAYLARQASVGVNPITDSTNTYWQPFGSTVQADGETLIVSQSGVISLNLDNNTIVYDSVLGKVKVDSSVLDKALSQLTDVTISSVADGDCLVYNLNDQKWENSDVITQINSSLADKQNKTLTTARTIGGTSRTTVEDAFGALTDANYLEDSLTSSSATKALTAKQGKALKDTVDNAHKVSTFEVAITGWSSDTSSQSGTTLYKKSVSLSHAYVACPTVEIGTSGNTGLPTSAQQTAFNLLQYVTIDGTTLYLYASAIPTDAFYIKVTGVD